MRMVIRQRDYAWAVKVVKRWVCDQHGRTFFYGKKRLHYSMQRLQVKN